MSRPFDESEPGPQRLAPGPERADVGVVMAMPIEAGPLLDRLQRVRRYNARSLTVTEGELEGRVVAVIVSGVGRASIRRGAERLIAGHRPRVLISAGFAGTLDATYVRNDLVAPRTVIDGSGGSIEIDESLVATLPAAVKPGAKSAARANVRKVASRKAPVHRPAKAKSKARPARKGRR